MAYDKVVDSAVLDDGLTVVADAIRQKTDTTEDLSFPAGFAAAIMNISSTSGAVKGEVLTITIPNQIVISGTIVAGNDFVKENYNRPGFIVILKYLGSQNGSLSSILQGNMNLGHDGKECYGISNIRTGQYSADSFVHSKMISDSTQSGMYLLADSAGNLTFTTTTSTAEAAAGEYKLIMLCVDVSG